MKRWVYQLSCSALLLCLSAAVAARSTICAETPDASYLSLEYTPFDSVDADKLPPSEADLLRFQWEALVLGTPERRKKKTVDDTKVQPLQDWSAGVGHEYTRVEFDPQTAPEPQSNGDLHTLYAPVHWWQQGQQQDVYRVSFAPAISVSSNSLKNPDKLNSDTLQLWLALEHRRRVSAEVQWLLGLCADHRFGHYQGYPIAGLLWLPSKRWSLRLAYPDTEVSYRPLPKLSLAVAIHPDGNEWQVLDSELERRTKYSREAWRLEGRVTWTVLPALSLSVALGKSLEQELQFSLEDNRLVQTDVDDASYWSLQLRWTFSKTP